jgi:hypothetical protein
VRDGSGRPAAALGRWRRSTVGHYSHTSTAAIVMVPSGAPVRRRCGGRSRLSRMPLRLRQLFWYMPELLAGRTVCTRALAQPGPSGYESAVRHRVRNAGACGRTIL